jgi:hypothetical protein
LGWNWYTAGMNARYKKLTIIALLVILIIGVLFIFRYKNNSGQEKTTLDTSSDSGVVIQSSTPQKITKKTNTYEIDITYPVFNNAAIDREIADFINRAEQDFIAMFEQDDFYVQMGITGNLFIEYSEKPSPKGLSIIFTGYQYAGGAHPNPFVHTIVIQDGVIVTMNDFFTVPESEYLTRLRTLSLPSLKKQLGNNFFQDGLDPVIDNWKNWYLINNAMIVLFAPYQVGPYAVGMPEVIIPFTQIQDIMQ